MTAVVPRKAMSPKEAHDLWVSYGQARDLEALLSLYEPGGSIFDVGRNRLLTTPEERREFLSGFIQSVDFELYTASITMSGDGTLALLRSKWFAKGVSKDGVEGRQEWTARNCGAEIVRKQPDGSWLFIIDNPYAATSWDAFPEY
jgi:ketosteroid isomerase-like protein